MARRPSMRPRARAKRMCAPAPWLVSRPAPLIEWTPRDLDTASVCQLRCGRFHICERRLTAARFARFGSRRVGGGRNGSGVRQRLYPANCGHSIAKVIHRKADPRVPVESGRGISRTGSRSGHDIGNRCNLTCGALSIDAIAGWQAWRFTDAPAFRLKLSAADRS